MEIISKKRFFWVKKQLDQKEHGKPCQLKRETVAELREALKAADLAGLPFDVPKRAGGQPVKTPTTSVSHHGDQDDPPPWETDGEVEFLVAPVEIPLKPAATVAQVRWAWDMVAQYPRKSQEQIARENHTSWEQLTHWAQSSTQGLPERTSKSVKAKAKEPAQKPATKALPKSMAKAASKPRAKQAQ
jgi:hypothetical protein